MLSVPNIIWAKNKPKDYEKYVQNENRILSILEMAGEALVIFFSIFLTGPAKSSEIILLISIALMILYECYWIKYFKSPRTMADMYTSFLWIPLAGATLPVMAYFLLGIYELNVFLMISSVILGIGHIGIHRSHQRKINLR